MLSIIGVVLFLRLGFAVGQMGWLASLGIFAFSEARPAATPRLALCSAHSQTPLVKHG